MTASTRGARNRAETMAAETSTWIPQAPGLTAVRSAFEDSPLFEGMGDAEVRTILAEFDEVRFPSGRRVVLEGLRGSDFFLVVSGAAAVLVDGWRVATLGPGDFFGEMAILGDGLRTASVRAQTPLHCLVLPNGKLERLLLEHPALSLNLLHALVGRFANVGSRRQPPAAEMAGA